MACSSSVRLLRNVEHVDGIFPYHTYNSYYTIHIVEILLDVVVAVRQRWRYLYLWVPYLGT